jgi:hypothetical protein
MYPHSNQRSESHVPYKFSPLKARFKGRYSLNFISLQGKTRFTSRYKVVRGMVGLSIVLKGFKGSGFLFKNILK